MSDFGKGVDSRLFKQWRWLGTFIARSATHIFGYETIYNVDDLFYLMCTNNFYPKIMFPTRIAKRSDSLLDQIFSKVPCKEQADISAAILLSGISDHFPCVVNFKILNKRPVPSIYIYKRSVTESSIEQYRADPHNLNIHTHFNADLMTDPIGSYQTFENLMQNTYERRFPKTWYI